MGRPVRINYANFCTHLQRMVNACANDGRMPHERKLKVTAALQEAQRLFQESHKEEMEDAAKADAEAVGNGR